MNKFVRKMTTSAVALATVVSMSGAAALVPSVASAATVAELEAQIQALLAQLATLTGGSTTTTGGACYTFTRDLTVGSQGEDVMNLQKAMNAMGFTVATSGAGSAGAESTYFGAKTQAAVAAWQAANGVAPAAGYFGPKSRTAYAASCSTTGTGTGTGTTGSTTLKGGAGSLADADFISSLNNEEVGEDEEDVEVAGLEIEAEGSDIMITAVTLDFDYADSGGDDDFDDYADEVSIWLDGEEVARLDADEFDDDNNYAKTVALDSGAIIEEDEVGELVVAVSGVKNLDSTNAANGNWNVAFEGIRFRDAQNAVVTDTTTGDITVGNDNTTTDTGERGFSFETFATAADLEVKFDEDDDSINDAHVIDIDATDDTDNVAILSFEIEVEGDSDVTMDDLPVDFYSVGVNLDDAISAVSLWYDGDEIGSENMTITTTNGTTTFDDLDLTLDAGETHQFEVRADFKSIADGIAGGDTVQALISSTNADNADIEDENGDNVADADVTGSATGEAHALYDNGIMVELVGTPTASKTFLADESGEADQVTFTFVFDVTSFGSDIYLDDDMVATATPSTITNGHGYASTSQATVAQGATSTVSATITPSAIKSYDNGTSLFKVEEDDTRRFTVSVVSQAAQNGAMQMQLTGINWGTSGASESAPDQLYNFNLDEFVTGIVSVVLVQ